LLLLLEGRLFVGSAVWLLAISVVTVFLMLAAEQVRSLWHDRGAAHCHITVVLSGAKSKEQVLTLVTS
jgi:uncharacterized protein (DUF2141 family)